MSLKLYSFPKDFYNYGLLTFLFHPNSPYLSFPLIRTISCTRQHRCILSTYVNFWSVESQWSYTPGSPLECLVLRLVNSLDSVIPRGKVDFFRILILFSMNLNLKLSSDYRDTVIFKSLMSKILIRILLSWSSVPTLILKGPFHTRHFSRITIRSLVLFWVYFSDLPSSFREPLSPNPINLIQLLAYLWSHVCWRIHRTCIFLILI